jgi:hypothetical protein
MGNWANKWNSLQNEGGTVWLTSASVDTHLRLIYSNRQILGPIMPMVGFEWYYFRQHVQSKEDNNLFRISAIGPEVGLLMSF